MNRKFLLIALQQAWLGRGCCAPNPSVGAVLCVEHKIIARSYHHSAGTLHAEALLLQSLSTVVNEADLNKAVLYVTLEPCNHWGKTAPCTDLIIKKGVKKVVFAYKDPNPIVAKNNSTKILEAAGVKVEYSPQPEIDEFYQSYKFWLVNKTPFITAKLAISLDGKISDFYRPYKLTGKRCQIFTHKKRLHSDVILTTSKTILIDDPKLNVRYFSDDCGRMVAILDRNSKLTKNEKVFSAAKSIKIYDSKDQSLFDVIKDLGILGMHDVWVEAGPTLFKELHRLNLVHKTYIYIAPITLGKNALSSMVDFSFLSQAKKISWEILGDDCVLGIDWLG